MYKALFAVLQEIRERWMFKAGGKWPDRMKFNGKQVIRANCNITKCTALMKIAMHSLQWGIIAYKANGMDF